MGQRMGSQKRLGFKQAHQTVQSAFDSEVAPPRCMLLKPSPPILLPLTTDPDKPPSQRDLLEETQKNRKPDHLKPPIIEMGSQGMDRATVGTTIPLQQQCFLKPIKKPPRIAMTPQPWTPAPRAPWRTGPGVPLPLRFKKIDIDRKIKYQEVCLGG